MINSKTESGLSEEMSHAQVVMSDVQRIGIKTNHAMLLSLPVK